VKLYALVMLGGALGSAARFAVSTWCEAKWGANFPWGTFVVNVVGAFLIGLIFVFSESLVSSALVAQTRALLITGLLGGFTTFSAFSLQTFALLQSGRTDLAVLNVLGSVLVCLLAVWIGSLVGQAVAPRI